MSIASFLQEVGADFKNGLAKIDPFVKKVVAIANVAEPIIADLDPAIGAIFGTTVATIASIEQKAVAAGNVTGTGPQKLAEATTILSPVITQAFTAAGKASDAATVTKYINGVVAFLNGIPASGTAKAPAA